MSVVTVVVWLVGALLALSAGVVVYCIVTGPSVLDRVVALEVLVGIVICAIGVQAAVARQTTGVPVLLSLSLVGFVGAVTVARFTRVEDTTTTTIEVRR
ncbi:multisubunit sodium/proton antiporter, MrpF subunit [Kytococcus aerolatus]|uniref:Multisubunit sodium/proton antiporter, MrpF subunit n=1 Tax=Kytococcus aerolatus TaxID=592308 RepID=A0A212U5E2_9MICO|nr:monovalent cation/H+ antiporter complex subunit F [Kytococcus aerolatus]SNC73370.1 multisubunit sodium/proton antiporter, MrpF subunit [Kytococcus aerolatus]